MNRHPRPFLDGLGATIARASVIAVAMASPARAWLVHGSPVCSAALGQYSPVLVNDGAHGAIVVWRDDRGSIGIYAQRVDSTGAPQWAQDGVIVCDVPSIQSTPQAIPDAGGGAFITWGDRRSGEDDIYSQHIDHNGVLLWAANGVPLCTAAGSQSYAPLVLDRTNVLTQPPGCIAVWDDARVATNDYNVYVQHVDTNGSGLWALNGVALCTAMGNQNGAVIATDGVGSTFAQRGAIVAWTDSRNGAGNADIYARRVDASGVPQWASNGVPVCSLAGDQYSPKILYVGGAVLIVWADAARGGLYAQKVDVNGTALWTANGILVTGTPSDENLFAMTGAASGGAIVAWEDARNDGSDIYAQLFDANGAPQWGPGGVAVAQAPSTQLEPTIVPDNSGGAIVAWLDWRSGTGSSIYAQRLDATGQTLWALGGVRLSNVSFCHQVTSVSDGNHRAIVAWEDNRNGNSDVYANRVLDLTSVDVMTDAGGGFRIALRSPHPVRGVATLSLDLPAATSVLAEIFDVRGHLVRAFVGPQRFTAGTHLLSWDGNDDRDQAAGQGVYFVRVRAGDQTRTLKLVELH